MAVSLSGFINLTTTVSDRYLPEIRCVRPTKPPKAYVLPLMIFIWKEHSHTLLPPSMNADESSLGRCPECGEDISEAWILVEYKKNDGTEGVWTECPACGDVVAPE